MIPTATDRNDPPARNLILFLEARPRLDVVRPMLGDLETATTAGQHYVMGKVLVQLREAAVGAERCLPDSQRCAIRDTLTELARESERQLPNAGAFALRARMLADALSLA